MEALDVVVVLVAALLIIWDFAVFPALRGSRLSPVEGLRDA
jgi:ABC-type lipoprotein release transport system permease subunit